MHGIELQSNVHLSLKILEKDFKAQNGKHSLPSRNASSSIKELYLEQKKSGTVVKAKKIGRNDPCPCGSGKKYKYCCGKNA